MTKEDLKTLAEEWFLQRNPAAARTEEFPYLHITAAAVKHPGSTPNNAPDTVLSFLVLASELEECRQYAKPLARANALRPHVVCDAAFARPRTWWYSVEKEGAFHWFGENQLYPIRISLDEMTAYVELHNALLAFLKESTGSPQLGKNDA